jgi:polyphosphate glucokinase
MGERTALGIDIGGSGIKAAVVDLETGELATARSRVVTPQPAVPKAVSRAIAGLTRTPEFEGPGLVGAGFPAVIKHGLAETASNVDESWIGEDVVALLSAATQRRAYVLNDADAAGIAEMRFGAGRRVDGVVAMVTLGTGIGTGLFLDGKLFPNTELGHLEVRGRIAERRAAASVRDTSKLSWKRWAARVEEYLQMLERVIWPDLIIIGGGVSKDWGRFFPYIRTRAPLVAAQMQNDAGIVGAALYAEERAAAVGTAAANGVLATVRS